MKFGWALVSGIIVNLLFVILLFEARTLLAGSIFTLAFVLLMAASAWAAARVAASQKIAAGLGTVVPIVGYLIYVNLFLFRGFGLAELAIVLLAIGAGACGTGLAVWQSTAKNHPTRASGRDQTSQ